MKLVGVFVDVSTQYYAVLSAHRGSKIDYSKYLARAVGDDSLYRAFAYGMHVADESVPFIFNLERQGFEPRYRQVCKGTKESIWPMDIVMDIMRHMHRLDTVVLGSNDPIYVPVIHFLRERGIKTVILSCRIHPELRQAADLAIEINDEILERK